MSSGEARAIIGPIPEGRDAQIYDAQRRRLLWKMPSGLYLLGAMSEGRRNLMTLNWAMQVAQSPKLIGVAVECDAVTNQLIAISGLFTLSILHRDDRAVVRKFVRPAEDDRTTMTLSGIAYRDAPTTGLPVLASAIGYLECRVTERLDLGSHTLYIGEIVDLDGSNEGEKMTVLSMGDTRMNYGG